MQPLERKQAHLCAKILTLSHTPPHTHTRACTHDHPLGPQEKQCPVIIRHFLHTGANVQTCLGVVPLLTVKLNFFTPPTNNRTGDKPDQKSWSHFGDPWVHLSLQPQKHININIDIAPNPFTPPPLRQKLYHPRLAVNKALLTSPPRSKKKDNKEKVSWPNQ